MPWKNMLKAAPLGVAISVLLATAAFPQQGRIFGPGEPARAEDVPAGEFRDALLALEPRARARAMALLQGNQVPAPDFEFMRVDRRGAILYVDTGLLTDHEHDEDGEIAPPSEVTAANVFQLHSKPGASRVLYVDFDGHDLINTVWNTYSGAEVLEALPFSRDSDYSTFTQTEVNEMAEAWRRVAEDFAPFDIDVTTEEPPFTVLSTGRIQYGSNVGHGLVTRERDANGVYLYSQNGCGCGGVAYLNQFGNSYYGTGLNFNNSIGSLAETISHEFGHNLNLHHDATTTQGYYGGHGSGETSWGPIMGAPFGRAVTQWSRGTYPNAYNASGDEDDLAIIAGKLNWRPDDHEDANLNLATPLQVTGGVDVISTGRVTDPSGANLANRGVIEDRNDVDLFSMNIGTGTIDLTVTPSYVEIYAGSYGSNLDIEVKLVDEFGTVLQTSNPDLHTDAAINYEVTVAGTYYLEITGVGRGDPLSTGYVDYGSLGEYFINGTVPPDVVVTDPPVAPDDLSAELIGDVDIELSWTDPASTPESDEAGYRVWRSVNGATFGLRASLPRDSSGFSDNNLANGEYSYSVEVYNSEGADETAPTDPILIDVPVVAVATSESTTSGSVVSGSYLDTQTASGSETLQERHNGGRPTQRRSFLDHLWNVTGVEPGATVTLEVTASAPANSEDDFVFSYSVNGAPWTPLGTVIEGTGATTLTTALDPATSGTVRVRVVDSDPNTQGANTLDEVSVHQIGVRTGGDPGDMPPEVTILAPTDGLDAVEGASIYFEASAIDAEDDDLSASIAWSSDLDGPLGTRASFTTDALSVGAHLVTASASDSAGQDGSDQISVTVEADTPNTPPTATISSPANGASYGEGESISFAGSASDDEDGDVTGSLVWTSNLDGEIGTGGSFVTTLSTGLHTVTATAEDNGGLSDADQISVTVESADGISLGASGYKDKGQHTIDLSWSGATSSSVDIRRDGDLIATTANDGAYTDATSNRGQGGYTYQLCEAGTTTCSGQTSVAF